MTVSKWPANALIALSLGITVLSGLPQAIAASDTESLTKKATKTGKKQPKPQRRQKQNYKKTQSMLRKQNRS